MECKDAIRLIHPYLEGSLAVEEAETFLRHTETCASCREELEIYFTVMAAMDNLDRDRSRNLNLKGQFEEHIAATFREILFWNRIHRMRNAALMACGILIAAVVIAELQFLF